MAQGAHKITEQFEQELCKYTGSPYAVAVDNCSNALFLSLYYELNVKTHKFAQFIYEGKWLRPIITIPKHTYPSVACEIIHAGGKVEFNGNYHWFANSTDKIIGSYQLHPTRVWDSALSFTHNMYKSGQLMCVSFTGPYKHLKLGKGGAILTDDAEADAWFRLARFSGRSECSYFEDNFDRPLSPWTNAIAGWNFYMMPEIAARGLLLMQQFYDRDGKPKHNEDLCLHYPDLSKFKLFQQ
jgi:dTDP-4-amino-4,6-dideoxygalactose transaminase